MNWQQVREWHDVDWDFDIDGETPDGTFILFDQRTPACILVGTYPTLEEAMTAAEKVRNG